MSNSLTYKFIKPDEAIADYVYGFTSLKNLPSINEGVIIPNGRIDLHFTETSDGQFRISLVGLESKPKPLLKQNISTMFTISLNPLATEYILRQSVADLLNGGKAMPNEFWNFGIADLRDFDEFCEKATRKIRVLMPEKTDERKRQLFELIFATNGEMSVKELSEKVSWSERQINRYFNQQFGISLKALLQNTSFSSVAFAYQRRSTLPATRLLRPVALHQRNQKTFGRIAERIIQESKRPIFTILVMDMD